MRARRTLHRLLPLLLFSWSKKLNSGTFVFHPEAPTWRRKAKRQKLWKLFENYEKHFFQQAFRCERQKRQLEISISSFHLSRSVKRWFMPKQSKVGMKTVFYSLSSVEIVLRLRHFSWDTCRFHSTHLRCVLISYLIKWLCSQQVKRLWAISTRLSSILKERSGFLDCSVPSVPCAISICLWMRHNYEFHEYFNEHK